MRQYHHDSLGGAIMKNAKLAIISVSLLYLFGATVLPSGAATTFNGNGSTIVGIDEGQRTITFRTREGQNWTLPVADPDILKGQFSKGDQVSIEIDLEDRITKVLKPSDDTAAPAHAGDELSQ
jgi:hypothetical protein